MGTHATDRYRMYQPASGNHSTQSVVFVSSKSKGAPPCEASHGEGYTVDARAVRGLGIPKFALGTTHP